MIINRYRSYIKFFLIVFAIYSFAMLSIWRANITYMDDVYRAVRGGAWSHEFSRYSQTWLLYILNVAIDLTDISPLPQIAAMVFLSVSGVMVTYIFSGKDKEIRYIPLILSAFIGLSPFTSSNWLFKFDAPGMALGIFVSIIPMLFWYPSQKMTGKKPWIIFFAASTICLMVMWTSYQASNGIYLVMAAGLAFRDFLERRKIKEILKTIMLFAVPYLVSAIIYRFVLPAPTGHVSIAMHPFSDMLSGIMRNIVVNINFLRASLNTEWMIFIALTITCFVASLLFFSKRKRFMRLIDVAAGIVFALVSIPASYGVLLLLLNPMISHTLARSVMNCQEVKSTFFICQH